jgi:hypothetical protein
MRRFVWKLDKGSTVVFALRWESALAEAGKWQRLKWSLFPLDDDGICSYSISLLAKMQGLYLVKKWVR